VKDVFRYARNHNDQVFAAYDDEIKAFRSNHIVTGLPDNYARGRIIGDYRRLALYGIDAMIETKIADKAAISGEMNDDKVRHREEISAQIQALKDIKIMASSY
jgi:formate C-acetyltransferase